MKARHLFSTLLALPLLVSAAVKVPSFFGDHAVLARSSRTTVFGKADPGEKVEVRIAGQTATTTTSEQGRWRVALDLSQAPDGPHTLTIAGTNTLTFKDILIGEVWLCSGQSNMGFALRSEQNAKQLIDESANDSIRLFKVRLNASITPLDDVKGAWTVCSPKTVPHFSAVGYLFGRDIQKVLKRPVGLIDNAWGGSAAEAWMTLDALHALNVPKVTEWSDRTWNTYVNYKETAEAYVATYAKWLAAVGRDEPTQTTPPADAKWQEKLNLNGRTMPGHALVWFRHTFSLTPEEAAKPINIQLGQLAAPVAIFVDGVQVGKTSHLDAVYGRWANARLKPNALKAGQHELLVRVWCTEDRPRNHYRAGKINNREIGSNWAMTSTPLPKLTQEQLGARPQRPAFIEDANKVPALLYNALIHPLMPLALSGCVWYQGCTNAGRADTYASVIQGMIREWRQGFETDFPFYYCQLANFLDKSNNPNSIGWAAIRHGQEGALQLPKTGQAVIIDVGEAKDIHPLDKTTVAARLAALALNQTYGLTSLPCSGPVAQTAIRDGDGRVRITFSHVYDGLEARPVPAQHWLCKARQQQAPLVRNSPDSQLEGFAVAGPDGQFVWADARIDGHDVIVWSAKVPQPTTIRYAWQSNPTCNLYNRPGFPAAPFEMKVK